MAENKKPAFRMARIKLLTARFIDERVGGIEPPASAWKAEVLPLYDTRKIKFKIQKSKIKIINQNVKIFFNLLFILNYFYLPIFLAANQGLFFC